MTRKLSTPNTLEVVAVLQESRRPRTGRSFTDWYVAVLAMVLAVASIGGYLVLRTTQLGCIRSPCPLSDETSSLTLLLLSTAVTSALGMLRGPVSVTAAEAFWVFSSPLPRGPLLARRKVGILLGGALGGVAMGLLHFAVWNANPWWLLTFPVWSALAMSIAMLLQGGASRVRRAGVAVLILSTVTAAFAAVTLPPNVFVSVATVPTVTVVLGAALLGTTIRRGLRRSNALSLQSLRRAHSTGDAVAGAVSAADSGLLLDVATLSLLAGRSFVPRFRVRGVGWRAVLSGEVQRLLRSPLLLARLLLLLTALALAHLTGIPELLAAISLSTLFFTGLGASAFRQYVTSPALARSFPQSAPAMRVLLALPTILLAVGVLVAFSVVATLLPGPPLPDGFTIGAAIVAGIAGGFRWATSAPTQFSAGVVMTEAGPVHISAILNAVRGFDVVLIVVVILLTGVNPLFCLAIAVAILTWVVLRD